VIEINQARALAGSVTPGDAPGFPVEIFTRGSFRLTSDLAVPAGAGGISVHASGTRIDLNGFTLSSTTECSGAPLVCAPTGAGVGITVGNGVNDVSVRDGRVAGFGFYGVFLLEESRAERLTVESNGERGIYVGPGCVVTDNIVRRNGGIGIEVGAGSRVFSNLVSGNAGWGAVLGLSTGFAHNTFDANEGGSVSGGRATAGNACDDGGCSSTGARRFYLSVDVATGAQALTACASGFHMASLFEIWDVSRLFYDVALGRTLLDSGRSAPAATPGWIRTGSTSSTSFNCAAWTTSDSGSDGIRAFLTSTWLNESSFPIAPWESSVGSCDVGQSVWCVED
jgi:hypothetical protein